MYALIDEPQPGTAGGGNDDGCNWGLFFMNKNVLECLQAISFAVINLDDKSDPKTPEGFHAGHYCTKHALDALLLHQRS